MTESGVRSSMVEQVAHNHPSAGSIPAGHTKKELETPDCPPHLYWEYTRGALRGKCVCQKCGAVKDSTYDPRSMNGASRNESPREILPDAMKTRWVNRVPLARYARRGKGRLNE